MARISIVHADMAAEFTQTLGQALPGDVVWKADDKRAQVGIKGYGRHVLLPMRAHPDASIEPGFDFRLYPLSFARPR